MTRAQQLRQILDRPEILVLPGVYDCIGSRLVQELGFEVVFTSGFGISAATLGLPDYGFLTATEMLSSAGRIAASVSIPVVADMDTGYGNPLNVMRTVEEALRLDLAGIILEDQEWPKKCGHFEGKRVISLQEHVEKIHAAREVSDRNGLVLIARTDALAARGMDEALTRGRAYYEAGADVIFVEAPGSQEELETIAEAFPGIPLFANMIEGGKTPLMEANQLQEMGFRIVVFPLAGLFSATHSLMRCLQYLRKHGTTSGLESMLTFEDFEELIDVEHFRKLEDRFST